MTRSYKTFSWNSMPVRIASGVLITLLLMLPMKRIEFLINERESNSQFASRDIYNAWSRPQTLNGPYVVVPYTSAASVKKGNTNIRYFLLTPDRMHIEGEVLPTEKKRGIYKTIVYQGDLRIKGRFDSVDTNRIQQLDPKLKNALIYWDQAQFRMDISDLKGLSNEVELDWDGSKSTAQSFSERVKLSNGAYSQSEGFSAPLQLDIDGSADFALQIKLKGSQYLNFAPVSRSTEISLRSPWTSPKYIGNHLPEHTLSKEGFEAGWSLTSFNRPVPYASMGSTLPSHLRDGFGVELIQPVNGYLKATRATKYALLFIVLTFVGLIFVELFTRRESKLLQYILTGVALVLFYSLLVSLSEHIAFDKAYFISATAIVLLISAYIYSLSKQLKTTLILMSMWGGLYTYLFFILQMEDYALLAGNIGLFVILAIIMFTSRKLRFDRKKPETTPSFDNGDLL